ncbi:unnamed protein product [Urochloa decumbens]|uniref:Protein kinase domain-containing protein n=1 Tax=Urochloa decumbens TaxID=240449 RepID=A0ABC9FLM6_9POAL
MRSPTLLLSIVLMTVCTTKDAIIGAQFIYNGFAGSNLHLDGEASITQDGVLTLTTGNSNSSTVGHGFHPEPLSLFREDHSFPCFSTTFVFSVTPNNTERYGYGMAFVISSTPDLSGALADRYMGLESAAVSVRPPFFAIELHTVTDDYWAGEDNLVSINLNDLTPVISSPAGYRYKADIDNLLNFEALRLSSGKPTQVWVDVDCATMEVSVTLALVPMHKPPAPLISYGVLPSDVLGNSTVSRAYMGFSASSGGTFATAHQILGWSFNVTGPAQPLNYSLLPLKRPKKDGNIKRLMKWLPATVSFLTLLAGSAACLVLRRWRKKHAEGQEADWEAELGPRRFSHKVLRAATNGFGTTQLLGKGGFGSVYAGVLAASGLRVAVKRISSASTQGLAQFTAEIIILGRLRHRNLVRLIGYCRHKDELLLVYEQMPNGSLDSYLHGQTTKNNNSLIWSQRFRIIKGVASGLLYLHEDWEQVIIHRDVKASNVLLDAEMNGRLGDFGLARLHDHGADAHTTHVAGTRGYLAPELLKFGKATKATDVFAFGAFILEVACGRRPMGLNARGELLVLVEWVRQVWVASGCVADAMDPRLVDYAEEEAELVLMLGLLCSHPLPGARPGMRLVMQYLDGDLPLPEFSPDYLAITDGDQVVEMTPSVATTITSLSGGR